MEKIVVVSTNNNPDYYFYSPYILKAWNSYGWKVAVVITHDVDPANVVGDYIIQLPDITGLRTETQAQGGRLYAANYLPVDSLVMTSDMDLLPLSDYWHPKEDEITVYGHDLTDYSYIPMGYVAMKCSKWKEVLNLTFNTVNDFIRDSKDPCLKNNPYSSDWETWWGFDWDLLTNKLAPYKDSVTHIHRGRRGDGSGFAYGRIDRGDSMKLIEGQLIDSHCENHNIKHPDKLNKFLSIFESVYGKL